MIKNTKKEKEIGDFSYIDKKKRMYEMSYVTAYNGRNDRNAPMESAAATSTPVEI